MKQMRDSGSHSLVAVYMGNFFWLSLPVSIHKKGVRPTIFSEVAVALVEGT